MGAPSATENFRPQENISRSQRIAVRGIRSTRDFANLMTALMADVLDGSVDPLKAKAVTGAGAMLLKTVEIQQKYGRPEIPLVLAEADVHALPVPVSLPARTKPEGGHEVFDRRATAEKEKSATSLVIEAMSPVNGRRDTIRLIAAWVRVDGAAGISDIAVENTLEALVEEGKVKPKPAIKDDPTDRWMLA